MKKYTNDFVIEKAEAYKKKYEEIILKISKGENFDDEINEQIKILSELYNYGKPETLDF